MHKALALTLTLRLVRSLISALLLSTLTIVNTGNDIYRRLNVYRIWICNYHNNDTNNVIKNIYSH